jgi:AcrR family transcriptional regulator
MIIYYLVMRYKDENKKENIFLAAMQLINEIGFSETSMSKIAKEANVSPSTIYVYFENKNDMLNKLYLSVKQKISQKMFQGIDESTPLEVGYELALRNLIDFALNNKEYLLFIEQFTNSPLIHNLCREEGRSLFRPMHDLFEKGKKQNVLKQVDTNLLITYFYSPIIQLVKEYYNGGFELNKENLDKMIQMSFDAIKV